MNKPYYKNSQTVCPNCDGPKYDTDIVCADCNNAGVTDTDKSPREWTLKGIHSHYDSGRTTVVYLQGGPAVTIDEQIRVIEKSAYDALAKECAELRLLTDKAQANATEWMSRYRSIVLANQELSRNDHKTYGDLLLERNDLQAKLTASRERERRLMECVEYFVARCEDRHPDGYIRSNRTYEMFKKALAEHKAEGEK